MLTPAEIDLVVQSSRVALPSSAAERIRSALASDIRWAPVLKAAALNRVAPLMARTFRDERFDAHIPDSARRFLDSAYDGCRRRAEVYAEEVRRLLRAFRSAGIPVMLLRGLAVGEVLYGDCALRPFTDIDLLVLPENRAAAKSAIRALGYRTPSTALPDGYFERHHLHLAYVRREPATRFDVELHWSLDHKYTRWLVDYREMFARARQGSLVGVEALLPSKEDELLTLAIHLVKHNYFAAALWHDGAYGAAVLAERGLIWHCDVAEFLRQRGGELAWDRLAETAQRWSVSGALAASLYSTAGLLGDELVPFPHGTIAPPVTAPADRVRARVARAALWPQRSSWVRFLLGKQAGAIFRPVRALDVIEYVFPGSSYLRRRYRRRSVLGRIFLGIWHALRALAGITANGLDYVVSRTTRRVR